MMEDREAKRRRLKRALFGVKLARYAAMALFGFSGVLLLYIGVIGQFAPSGISPLVPTLEKCAQCNGYGYVYCVRGQRGIDVLGAPNTMSEAMKHNPYVFTESCSACATGALLQWVPVGLIGLTIASGLLWYWLNAAKKSLHTRLRQHRHSL